MRRALNAVVLVLVIGTCGYMWIEGWDFWQSLFFTVITLTTVGYGDYGLSDPGLRFTTILLVGGLGVVTYAAGQLVPIVFDHRLMLEWKMNRQIQRLSDHFIVCGLGRVGRGVCSCLAAEGVPFVIVERDPEVVEWAEEHGYLAVTGDATRDEVLNEVGILWARSLACVTDCDTENTVIVLGARQLNPDLFIIARTEDETTVQRMQRAGASRVISPSRAGAHTIAEAMVRPNLAELLDRSGESDDGIELAELTIHERSELDGVTVQECGALHDAIVFVALKRPGERTRFRPAPDESLRTGDILITAGDVIAVGRLQDEARTPRLAA